MLFSRCFEPSTGIIAALMRARRVNGSWRSRDRNIHAMTITSVESSLGT